MENILLVSILASALLNILLAYLGLTGIFWYMLIQSKNNLRMLSKSNFRDVKMRNKIHQELAEINKDMAAPFKWPLYVYELIKFKREKSKQQEKES